MGIKGQAKIESWLYQVTRNAIIDHYRTNKTTEELPVWLEQQEASSEDKVQRELASCLAPMINQLPEKYRLAIYLSEIDGKNQKEIAERENISLSGAKSRVQRGRVLLKKMLQDCCEIQINKNNQLLDYHRKKTNSSNYSCEN